MVSVIVILTHEDYTRKGIHINDGNKKWVKVHWDIGKYPSVTNSCDGLCKRSIGRFMSL